MAARRASERYLSDRPVVARPPSVSYRFRKFASRNKTGLAITATLLVLGMILGFSSREVARKNAEMEAQRAASEAVNEVVTARPANVLDRVKQVPDSPNTEELLVGFASRPPEDLDDRRQLHARMALVARDEAHVPELLNALLRETADYC